MKQIQIRFLNGKELTVDAGKTPQDFLEYFDAPKDAIYAAEFNNKLISLIQPLTVSGILAPVVKGTRSASTVYRESLSFVLCSVCHAIFPGVKLVIAHSLGYAYYYTLEKTDGAKITSDDIAKIKTELTRVVAENEPLTPEAISYAEACALFESIGLVAARESLKYICPPIIKINTMRGFSEPYFGPLVASTGFLKSFDIRAYDDGFLLHFPSTTEPDTVAPFEDIPRLFSVYKNFKHWGKQLGVTSAPSINKMVYNRTVKDFVDITELLQQKQIGEIADRIASRKTVKLVLMAGPSSSGKTTSSKKLSMQLRALGFRPKVLELDTYYVEREFSPKDANGNYDYECLEALEVALLGKDLNTLFEGGEINVPSYDFTEGRRFYTGHTMKLEQSDILILEGIHGLNDRLTPDVPREYKFKLYLSAITQLNLDDHNRVPTSDNRLLRRIVRDSQFRGKSATETIKMWDNVQKGERLHIFPFQNNADAILNTALDYEIPVLKVFADPLLRAVTPFEPEYAQASRLLSFLDNFLPISPALVPGKSIIREFIGDSDFVY